MAREPSTWIFSWYTILYPKGNYRRNRNRCLPVYWNLQSMYPQKSDALIYSKSLVALASYVLEMVHTYVCGKLPVPYLGRLLYFVSPVYCHSRYSWIYAIKSIADLFLLFRKGLSIVELQTGCNLKALHSDNGGEYQCPEMKAFLIERKMYNS